MEQSVNVWQQPGSIFQEYQDRLGISRRDVNTTSLLAMAYLGDCVYDLFARDFVLAHAPGNVNRMNRMKTQLVCAHAQSEIMGWLIGEAALSEEELSVYRRGRNQKSETHSKNSSIQEYRRATGFEALLGYLYMKGDMNRMGELISRGIYHIWDDLTEASAGETEVKEGKDAE